MVHVPSSVSWIAAYKIHVYQSRNHPRFEEFFFFLLSDYSGNVPNRCLYWTLLDRHYCIGSKWDVCTEFNVLRVRSDHKFFLKK